MFPPPSPPNNVELRTECLLFGQHCYWGGGGGGVQSKDCPKTFDQDCSTGKI